VVDAGRNGALAPTHGDAGIRGGCDHPGGVPVGAPPPCPRQAVAFAALPATSRTRPAPPPRQCPPLPFAPTPVLAGAAAGPAAAGPALPPPRRGYAPAAPPATPGPGAGVAAGAVVVAAVGASDPAPLVATPGAPVTRNPPRGAPRRDAPGHPPPPAETTRGPDDGSGNAAVKQVAAAAVGDRRRGDDHLAGRRVATRTSGRDVAAKRESRGSGGQDATVSAIYLTGAAHTAQESPPRPGDLRGGVWAEWGYDPVVNRGQVTDAMLGLALLECGRAAR